MNGRRIGERIWLMPVAFGLVSALGLAAALLFGAWGNALSWLALTAVVATSLVVCVRALPPRSGSGNKRKPTD